jgi:hypothetical protein
MRFAIHTVIVCLGLLVWTMRPALSQSSSAAAQVVDPSSDAAERHAKRTACLKEAKSKKLVGAQKTAYLKDCMAGIAPTTSQTAASATSP